MDKSRFSFLDGVIVDSDTIRVIGVEDDRAQREIPHGLIMTRRNDQWRAVEVGERLVACTTTDVLDYAFIAVAESGREVDIGNNVLRQEVVAVGTDSPTSNGPLTAVQGWASGAVFCVGTARQVYRKTGNATWDRVDQTCKSEDPDVRSTSAFLAVDGFAPNEAYAAGWDGEIWRFDGSGWRPMDSPTNVALHGIHCAADGWVYACGQGGTLLQGRDSDWRVIDQSDTEEDLRSIRLFDGVLYTSSVNLIYKWGNNGLAVVKMKSPVATAGRLHAAGKQMLSVGLKDVVIFDGRDWHRIV